MQVSAENIVISVLFQGTFRCTS